jgi:hypothetical protein
MARFIAELQNELRGSTNTTSALLSTPGLRYYLLATGIARRMPLTGSSWMALALTVGTVALTGSAAIVPTPFIVRQPTGAVVTIDPVTVGSIPRSVAYNKFKETANWLGVTDQEATKILGVGRTTPYAWERRAHEPRPSKAGRLFEYHALLAGLVRTVGPQGLQSWLSSGNPHPRHLLRQGDLAGAYDAAHGLIFSDRYEPQIRLGALQSEAPVAPPRSVGKSSTDELKGSIRRARKMRV